jgi:hypothetical protein
MIKKSKKRIQIRIPVAPPTRIHKVEDDTERLAKEEISQADLVEYLHKTFEKKLRQFIGHRASKAAMAAAMERSANIIREVRKKYGVTLSIKVSISGGKIYIKCTGVPFVSDEDYCDFDD